MQIVHVTQMCLATTPKNTTGKYNNPNPELSGCLDCGPCQAGFWRTGCQGATNGECTACAAGLFKAGLGAHNVTCISCPSAFFSEEHLALGSASCTACPAGKYGDEDGQGACNLCLPGLSRAASRRCKGGNAHAAPDALRCTSYPNMTCRTSCDSSRFLVLLAPRVGLYKDVATPIVVRCADCPMGRYQNATGRATCKDCPAGQYEPTTGQTECRDCPANYRKAVRSPLECTACNPGNYSLPAAKVCLPCKAGVDMASVGSVAHCTLFSGLCGGCNINNEVGAGVRGSVKDRAATPSGVPSVACKVNATSRLSCRRPVAQQLHGCCLRHRG